MPHQLSSDIHDCIENCTNCHNICMETVAQCLQMGGSDADAGHIRMLLDCAEICATSVNVMLRGFELHPHVCGVCASACERCAESSERLANADELMLRCVELCRRCADSCRQIAA